MRSKSIFSASTVAPRLLIGLILISSLVWLPQSTLRAQPTQGFTAQNDPEITYRGVGTAVQFDVSPPLRDIPPAEIDPNWVFEDVDPDWGTEGPLGPQDADPVVQTTNSSLDIPSPIISFDAFDNQLTYTPPDPVGDVGPNHYVAMSNVHFAVFDKSGNLLYGPVLNNTLWSGFGGACETQNSGDPIVVYDQLADRWMLTQFTSSAAPDYYNCVALSQTGDPTGPYYRWAFSTGANFPDYPKYGIWPDAYYISTREFGPSSGIGAYALNRSQMLLGNPSPQVVSFLVASNYNAGHGLLPADLDGTRLPPAGSPQYFVGTMDDGGPLGAPQDALTLWEFDVDWSIPSNSSFTLASTLATAPFDSIFPCSPGSRDCIPQPDTTEKVDILSYRQRPLWRLAYRNLGSHEALVTNQAVEAAPNMAGIRWYEVRDPSSSPYIYQQGTYAPGIIDGVHRWMGSIAMDQAGNMALGYSASNGTNTYPSVWYTGRLASDPLGQMAQGEGVFVDGSGSQLSTGSRWGDYTSMNVDPVDDCTFWYINQYYPATSSTEWYLRVGAFKFPSCGATSADLSITKAGAPNLVAPGATLIYTLEVANAGPQPITTTVTMTDDLPAGVGLSSYSAPGWACGQVAQQFVCTTPTLTVGLASNIFITVTAPITTGYITNTAYITSSFDDSNSSDNVDQAVTLVDTAPLAVGDSYTTTEDNALTVTAPGVLDNDSDPDGDPLSATLADGPAHGDLSLNLDGSFVYTPTLNFAGGDTFTYTLSDGVLTDTAAVTLSVSPVNDPPVAQDDVYTTPEDTLLVQAAPGLLGNDSDLDGDPLSVTLTSGPVYGDLSLDAGGSFAYTPTLNWNGSDTFSYTLSDGVLTDTAMVTLTVTPVDDAPLAADDAYTTTEDTPLDIAPPGVLGNDSDPDGDPLSAVLAGGPVHGDLSLNPDGAFVYTPALSFAGSDIFSYTLSDGALTDTATVALTVSLVNEAPLAADDSYTTTEDTPLDVAAPGVLNNDSDPDDDPLSAALAGGPAHGDLSFNPDGSFVYTPTLNFAGSDTFSYTLSDGALTDTATVALGVEAINDAPAVDAGPDQAGDEGEPLSFAGSFVDPGLLAQILAGESIHWDLGDGSAVTGTLTPTHTYADQGIYTVTLIVTDSLGAAGADELLVTVSNVPPELAPLPDLSLTLGQGLTLTGSFSDPGWLDAHWVNLEWGDGMSDTQALAAGVLGFEITHTYTAVGAYTATVRVTDGDSGEDSLSFSVTVNPVQFQVHLPIVLKP